MISKKMFLVYFKSNWKLSNRPAIISPTHEDATNFCRAMKKSSKDYEIVSVDMMIGVHRESCIKADQKIHIPLDLNKTAYPIKCDVCQSNAVYFCDYHSCVYCMDHITRHDGGNAQFSPDANFYVP